MRLSKYTNYVKTYLSNAVRGMSNSVQDAIPIDCMYEDGTIYGNGLYTRIYKVDNINYFLLKDEERENVYQDYGKLLNSLEMNCNLQWYFINNKLNEKQVQNNVLIKDREDGYNEFREEYNGILKEKIKDCRRKTADKRLYVLLTVDDLKYESAADHLSRCYSELKSKLKKLGSYAYEMKEMEVVQLIHEYMNPDHRDDRSLFRPADLMLRGLDVQDLIAPPSIKRASTYLHVGRSFSRTLVINKFATSINDNFLGILLGHPFSYTVSVHIEPTNPADAIETIKRKFTSMNMNKRQYMKKGGLTLEPYIPYELQESIEDAKGYLKALTKENKKLFLMSFFINIVASSLKELNDRTEDIKTSCRSTMSGANILSLQQEEGFMSAAPLGRDLINIQRAFLTHQAAIFIPFSTHEIFQPGGFYYGINQESKNMIILNRKQMVNPAGIILGMPRCLAGDTKIRLADGTNPTIQWLAENMAEKEFEVYSFDPKTKKTVNATARRPKINTHVKEKAVVILNNGQTIDCSKEHRFMMEDGSFKEAFELKPGMQLMPELKVVSVSVIPLVRPMPMYDLTVDYYENFLLDSGVFVHNCGKSFATKREIVNVLLGTDDDVIIIDPENEYMPLTQGFNGQVINVSPSSPDHMNFMDIDPDYGAGETDPISAKVDYLMSYCECASGTLTPGQKTIIDRVARKIYTPFMANFDPEKMPLPSEFLNQIKEQPEKDAEDLALNLELYITGSFNNFAHKTNVSMTKRLTTYNILNLGENLKKQAMLVILNNVWNRVLYNFSIGKRTWVYIDEFSVFFPKDGKSENTAAFFNSFFKRSQKRGCIPTAITQNVEEILEHIVAKTMVSNSEFLLLFKQAPSDRKKLAEMLSITDTHLSYVKNPEEGQGLMCISGVMIPFEDKFPKDTNLYRRMTTKVTELFENSGKGA